MSQLTEEALQRANDLTRSSRAVPDATGPRTPVPDALTGSLHDLTTEELVALAGHVPAEFTWLAGGQPGRLRPAAGELSVFEDYLSNLRDEYRRRSSLMRELDRAGLSWPRVKLAGM